MLPLWIIQSSHVVLTVCHFLCVHSFIANLMLIILWYFITLSCYLCRVRGQASGLYPQRWVRRPSASSMLALTHTKIRERDSNLRPLDKNKTRWDNHLDKKTCIIDKEIYISKIYNNSRSLHTSCPLVLSSIFFTRYPLVRLPFLSLFSPYNLTTTVYIGILIN